MKTFSEFFYEEVSKTKYQYYTITGDVQREFENAKSINKREFSYLPGTSKMVGRVGMYDRNPEVVKKQIVDFLSKKGHVVDKDYTITPTKEF